MPVSSGQPVVGKSQTEANEMTKVVDLALMTRAEVVPTGNEGWSSVTNSRADALFRSWRSLLPAPMATCCPQSPRYYPSLGRCLMADEIFGNDRYISDGRIRLAKIGGLTTADEGSTAAPET